MFKRINNDYPMKWQMYFNEEASNQMIGIRDLHDEIMFYLIFVSIFVGYFILINILGLISNKINIRSRDLNHSTLVEVIWTILPALTLVIIAIPTFKLLYSIDEIIKPVITLKVLGNQWFWNYSILDFSGFNIEFTSYPKSVDDLSIGEPNLLEVDNRIVLPILKPIRVLVSASDVIHSWAIPSLGIKIDAITGRVNHGLIYILREGLYYGQCSELCGSGHYYMPIVIEGVKEYQFINWLFSMAEFTTSNFVKFIKFI